MDQGNPRSTAKVAGHPIHPMTVMFPVVLFIATLVCDILFAWTGELFWATLGLLSLGLGILTAAVAAVFGLIDYFGDRRVRAIPSATHHMVGNVLVTAIQIGNWVWRFSGGPEAIVPTGLILSTIAFLLLGYSGWKGATLVYEHGVGVDGAKGASERHSRVADHQRAVDSGQVGRQSL
jgi:uncharacterized membrane protein